MKAVALTAVLLLARGLALAGHDITVSVWALLALVSQDLAVAALFAGADRLLKRSWLAWPIYALIVLYAAVNVPVQRAFSSPLTWTMLCAAGGPLADSIRYYATWQNGAVMVVILAAGAGLPCALGRMTRRLDCVPLAAVGSTNASEQLSKRVRDCMVFMALAGALGFVGEAASARADIGGLHRNPLVALITSGIPHVRAAPAARDWAASPFGSGVSEDLSAWRAACPGRNVILILLESTGAQYLRAFGGKENPTPCLTALANDAILFENAYCVYPESIKGLFSVLCSQSPAFDTSARQYARWATPALGKVLASHGYRRGLFHSGRFMYLGMESIIRNRGYEVLADAGDIGGNHESSFGIEESATVERMLEWIDSLGGSKFFVTYLPIAGHHPYASTEPGPFAEDTERGRYFNALHAGDAALAQLIAGLKARGLLERTLLVFCGDHSEAFGQHDGNYGHTLFIYEENVHVPLLLVAPELFKGSTRVKRVASLIDIAPTVLDLLGIAPPDAWQGRSLLGGREKMALFYADYALGWAGLRDGRFKFIHELSSGRSKLYDLEIDPREERDISGRFQGRTQAYRRHLLDWSAAQRARLSMQN